MTKKTTLVWRLAERPTVEGIEKLLSAGVINREEARSFLLNEQTEEDRDKKSLENEIKFLRELVEKLSQNRSQIVEVIKQVEKPVYIKDYWYTPYKIWCGSYTDGTVTLSTGTTFSSIKTF